jgi:CRP/FNR family cyclic AMP-dependent transcriptional regulator
MSDPDVGVRRLAAELLGDLDVPEAVGALIRGVRDDDPEVRATALRSLARAEAFAASDVIPEGLADSVPEVRLAALGALDALRADRSRARTLLADPDGLVRARAAGILLADATGDGAEDGPEKGGDEGPGDGPKSEPRREKVDAEAEATLARLTRSPHADARVAAFRALAASRSTDTMDLARTGLSDPAPSVRAEASRTMVSVDPVGGIEELLAAIAGGGDVLEIANVAMSSSPDRAGEPVRRLAAASAAQALESRRLADSIETEGNERLEMLRDSLLTASQTHALTALRTVALLPHRDAISTAVESLTGMDPAQRANALEVIESIGDHDLVRPLLALWERGRSRDLYRDWRDGVLQHPDDWIRTCAEWAIAATTAPTTTREAAEGGQEGGEMTETLATLPLVERVLFLRRVPLFAGLPPQDLVPIATIASEHSYADADTIAEQGEAGDEMHIIVTGYVMVILREPSGHQQVLAVRSAGDVIGEMAVITSGPRMASLAARGPVRLLSIGRRRFEAMLRERPETSLALMRVLCQRLADRDAVVPT